MEPTSVAIPDKLISVEVPGDKTCTTITLRKGKTYKCSVQAQNQCQLLSNHSDSIEIHIPGKLVHSFSNSNMIHDSLITDDVALPAKNNTAIVIIGVLFSVAALLFLSILVVYFALITQNRR